MEIVKVTTKEEFVKVEILAKEIWMEHFTPIIGENQVSYMLNKFLTHEVMMHAANEEDYAFYQMMDENDLFGFISIHPEKDMLFLSKLYIRKDQRGNGYARKSLEFIEALAKEMNLKGIWLTCNKYNDHTLAIYKRLGFEIFDEAVNDIGHNFVMDDYYLRKLI